MSDMIKLFESIIGKKPDAFLHEPVYQVTESEVSEFARAVLAQEEGKVVEQNAIPVYQVCNRIDGWMDVDLLRYTACAIDQEDWEIRTLYTSPPAPVAVVLSDEQILEVMRPAIYRADGGYVFDTAKEDVIAAGRAILDKLKELNP